MDNIYSYVLTSSLLYDIFWSQFGVIPELVISRLADGKETAEFSKELFVFLRRSELRFYLQQ